MYQCPHCKTDDNLRIYHDGGYQSWIDKDGNVMDSIDKEGNVINSIVGDSGWLDTDDALCGHCDWEGTVEHMTIEDEETQAEDAKEREEKAMCNLRRIIKELKPIVVAIQSDEVKRLTDEALIEVEAKEKGQMEHPQEMHDLFAAAALIGTNVSR